MIAILFSGGVGQRLWPLSRRSTPKQFVPLVGSKSSFELSLERLGNLVPFNRMFVATNRLYAGVLQKQAPQIPVDNFILEPVRRDVAAAVALAFFSLQKDGESGPVLFQWTDTYVKNTPRLLEAIRAAETLLASDRDKVIFIGERPSSATSWAAVTTSPTTPSVPGITARQKALPPRCLPVEGSSGIPGTS